MRFSKFRFKAYIQKWHEYRDRIFAKFFLFFVQSKTFINYVLRSLIKKIFVDYKSAFNLILKFIKLYTLHNQLFRSRQEEVQHNIELTIKKGFKI